MKITLIASVVCLALCGCGDKPNHSPMIPPGSSILETRDFSSYDACISQAKIAVSKRSDVKFVVENRKEDKEKNMVGVYVAMLKLKNGHELTQICTSQHRDSTASYFLVEPAAGIKVGEQLPGGLIILETQAVSTIDQCISIAKANIAKRSDIQSVKEDNQPRYAAVMVNLKTGGNLLYACMLRSDTRTDYILSGKGSGAVH